MPTTDGYAIAYQTDRVAVITFNGVPALVIERSTDTGLPVDDVDVVREEFEVRGVEVRDGSAETEVFARRRQLIDPGETPQRIADLVQRYID